MRQLLVDPAQLERCIADLRTTMCHYSSEADLEDRMDDYDEQTVAAYRLEEPSSTVSASNSSLEDYGDEDTYFSRGASEFPVARPAVAPPARLPPGEQRGQGLTMDRALNVAIITVLREAHQWVSNQGTTIDW